MGQCSVSLTLRIHIKASRGGTVAVALDQTSAHQWQLTAE